MSTKIKNQHYVPRFMLRKFCIKESASDQVWCFDKRTNKIFNTEVKNVCAEKAFYDLDEDQGAEHAFSDLEGRLCKPHRALLDRKDISSLSGKEKVGIAVLVAMQHMRTKSFRNTIKEAAELVANLESSHDGENPFFPPSNLDFREEDPAKRLQFELIGNAISAFVKSLLSLKWVLILNKTTSPFWFSDNPFVVYNAVPYDPHDGSGYERSGSQTHFPLSPDMVLSFVDPRSYYQYPSTIAVNEKDNVIFNNHLQVKNSERFIFSCDNDFKLAMQMTSEEPWLKNPSQDRFMGIDLKKL